jgi:GT2 family glycosyltransferase
MIQTGGNLGFAGGNHAWVMLTSMLDGLRNQMMAGTA